MIPQELLPSRRVVGIVIIPAFTIVGLWYVFHQPPRENKGAVQAVAFARALGSGIDEYNDRDTDRDLLKDWEEFLYQTDINKVDTDGDGLDDYQEVLDPIRDPLVPDSEKGRYTSSSTNALATSTPYYTEDPNLNATEMFARDIMTSFVQLQRADAFRTSIQDTVVQKVADAAIKRDKREAVVSLSDLQIIESPTKKQKTLYKEMYIDATQVLSNVANHEYVLLGYYSETQDEKYLTEIINNANAYENFALQLKNIPVPRDIAQVHTEVINNFYYLIASMRTMASAQADPLGALVSANKYREDEIALNVSLQALALYFSNL